MYEGLLGRITRISRKIDNRLDSVADKNVLRLYSPGQLIQMAVYEFMGARTVVQQVLEDDCMKHYAAFTLIARQTKDVMLIDYSGFSYFMLHSRSSYLRFLSGTDSIADDRGRSTVYGTGFEHLAKPISVSEVVFDESFVGKALSRVYAGNCFNDSDKILADISMGISHGVESSFIPEDMLPNQYFRSVSDWFEMLKDKAGSNQDSRRSLSTIDLHYN